MEIPKIIHYCWFGNNEKPTHIKRCIQSWRLYMPDYKIIEWNEKNYDCYKNEYMLNAYQQKKWAFVTDYVRFDVLYNYGGIYLDTDVELLQSIPEDIMLNTPFTCMEPSGKISPGLIFACEKHNNISKLMLDIYNKERFLDNNGKPICKTVNNYLTELLVKYGYIEKNETQTVKGLTIYSSDYFCSYDLDVMEPKISLNSVSIHHYLGTWRKKSLKNYLQKIIKVTFGVQLYRKCINFIRKLKKHI